MSNHFDAMAMRVADDVTDKTTSELHALVQLFAGTMLRSEVAAIATYLEREAAILKESADPIKIASGKTLFYHAQEIRACEWNRP